MRLRAGAGEVVMPQTSPCGHMASSGIICFRLSKVTTLGMPSSLCSLVVARNLEILFGRKHAVGAAAADRAHVGAGDIAHAGMQGVDLGYQPVVDGCGGLPSLRPQ